MLFRSAHCARCSTKPNKCTERAAAAARSVFDLLRSKRKIHNRVSFFLCFHYTIDEGLNGHPRKGRMCARNPSGVPCTFNSRPQAPQSAQQTAHLQKEGHAIACPSFWRCCPDLNWGMKVLQTFALPLGHSTGYEKRNAMRHSYFIWSG